MDIYVSGRNIWYPIMVSLTHEKDKTNLKKRNKNSNVSMEHKAGGVLSVWDTFNL